MPVWAGPAALVVCGKHRTRFQAVAVEWLRLDAAVLKVVLRLYDEPDLADVVGDASGGIRTLKGSWRSRRDLGRRLAADLREEVVGQRGSDPLLMGEQDAAVQVAADVVVRTGRSTRRLRW